ncbi:MAG: hypothetical protein RLZZ511_2983 [Cyanobacteriota bacterium]|jgi:hypothetical protein
MIFPKALTMSHECQKALQAIATAPAKAAALEVNGVLGTEFLGLDEVAPGMEWDELLAATWGLPYSSAATVEESRSAKADIKPNLWQWIQNCFHWAAVGFG